MPLKAYYDGSGKIDNPRAKFLVLAGFAAPDSTWAHLEPAWGAALRDHGAESLHMSELMSFKGQFSRENGWNEEKRHAFILGLMNVLGRFAGERLRAYSCCVALDDYRRVKEEHTSLRHKQAQYICIDFCLACCIGGLSIPPEDLDVPRPISLYFDQGEPFLNRIMRVYNSAGGKKAKNRKKGWPYQVASITAADSREVYPLQAADFLAWSTQRYYSSKDSNTEIEGDELYSCMFLYDHKAWFLGYDQLKERYAKKINS